MTAPARPFAPDLLAGRVALVTGGGTGIGRCTARELATAGCTVHLVGRRPDPLADAAEEIAAAGGSATWSSADVRDAAAVEGLAGEVVERHGRIDALVNNAGGQFPAPAEAISPNGWRAVVDLNLTGTFLVARAVFHAWMAAHGGAIVNVVADMWNGFPGMAHTGAARAGVVNLTQTLAVEWAARGVRVNAVAPGVIATTGLRTYPPEIQEAIRGEAARSPAGRLGTEREVAATIVFLLSPAAGFITGATVRVDGGASLVPRPLLQLPEATTEAGWLPPYP